MPGHADGSSPDSSATDVEEGWTGASREGSSAGETVLKAVTVLAGGAASPPAAVRADEHPVRPTINATQTTARAYQVIGPSVVNPPTTRGDLPSRYGTKRTL